MNPDKPMPLKDLPGYLNSVRESGQGDHVPVVDMGCIIEDPKPSMGWFRMAAYAAAACLLVAVGGVYAANSAIEFKISAKKLGPSDVADLVAGSGGTVFSVKQEESGTYKVKVFTFKRIGNLLDQLRRNESVDSVELGN
jgi:hypothetical protein